MKPCAALLIVGLLAVGEPAAASPAPPLAEICAALAVTQQDGDALSDADQESARTVLDDKKIAWKKLRFRRDGDLLTGAWGQCPAPNINLRSLAFSPDGQMARLESKTRRGAGSDGDIVLARRYPEGWRLIGWWQWVVITAD